MSKLGRSWNVLRILCVYRLIALNARRCDSGRYTLDAGVDCMLVTVALTPQMIRDCSHADVDYDDMTFNRWSVFRYMYVTSPPLDLPYRLVFIESNKFKIDRSKVFR